MGRKEFNLNQIQVKDLMTTQIKTIEAEEKISRAAQRMWNNDIHSLIVLNGDKLAGIITTLDLANVAMHLFTGKEEATVENFLPCSTIFTISPTDSVKKAIDIMAQNNVSHLPVLENDDIVGIFSSKDLLLFITGGKNIKSSA